MIIKGREDKKRLFAVNNRTGIEYLADESVKITGGPNAILAASAIPVNTATATTTGYLPSISDQVVYYYHQDHLGSTRAITDRNGNVVKRYNYYPFGEEIVPQTGLDYFGARYYSSKLLRWTSVDPIIFEQEKNKSEIIKHPQKWNLYNYCQNNPINRADLDGRVDGNDWRDLMPNGGGMNKVDGKEFREVMKWPLIIAGTIATVGFGKEIALEALTFTPKHPFLTTATISALFPGPPDANSAAYTGFVTRVIFDCIFKDGLSNIKETIKSFKEINNEIKTKIEKTIIKTVEKVVKGTKTIISLLIPPFFI